MPASIYIAGLGYYAPPRILTNEDMTKVVETSDEWIKTRTGIEERHVVEPGVPSSELAMNSSIMALESSSIKAEEITHVLVATVTPDVQVPSCAMQLIRKLGIKNAVAMDINAGCSGFAYALAVGQGLIAVNPDAKVLVIATEVLTSLTNWEDRTTCVLFGDGSGAAVITGKKPAEKTDPKPTSLPGVLEGVECDGDGSLAELLCCKAGGSLYPYEKGDVISNDHFLYMNGREVFKHAVRCMPAISKRLLDRLGYTMDDIDMLIPHQANLRIIEAVGQRLGIAREKVFVNVNRYGNTSAASIPIALCEAIEQGAVKAGMRVLLTTFGAGFTWASAVLKF